jgi:hypothetical protein
VVHTHHVYASPKLSTPMLVIGRSPLEVVSIQRSCRPYSRGRPFTVFWGSHEASLTDTRNPCNTLVDLR